MKRKKSGGVDNPRYYETDAFLSRIEPIRARLSNEHCIESSSPPKILGQIIANLIQFQEDCMGSAAVQKGTDLPCARIPSKLMEKTGEDEALYYILRHCCTFKTEKQWRRYDFSAPPKVALSLQMVSQIVKILEEKGFWKKPIVFIASSVKNNAALKEIVEKKGGKVVKSRKEATHIIQNNPNEEETDDLDYLRTVEIKGEYALVHWWYYPDSHNSLLPVSEVQGDPPGDDEALSFPVILSPRWITDLQKFNEWMNELDYDISEDVTDSSPSSSSDLSSSSSSSLSSSPSSFSPSPSPSSSSSSSLYDILGDMPPSLSSPRSSPPLSPSSSFLGETPRSLSPPLSPSSSGDGKKRKMRSGDQLPNKKRIANESNNTNTTTNSPSTKQTSTTLPTTLTTTTTITTTTTPTTTPTMTPIATTTTPPTITTTTKKKNTLSRKERK